MKEDNPGLKNINGESSREIIMCAGQVFFIIFYNSSDYNLLLLFYPKLMKLGVRRHNQ